MGLYTERILEHAKHPGKFGRLVDPDFKFEEVNPLCGDRIRVELRLPRLCRSGRDSSTGGRG